MGIFDIFRRGGSADSDRRSTAENPLIQVSNENFLQYFGAGAFENTAGVMVNVDTALGVPAIWAAVNFMSGTLAGLPMHVYKKSGKTRKRLTNGIAPVLHDAVNAGMSSFDWRKYSFDRLFTDGRSLTFIDRNGAGDVINLYPLDPKKVKISRVRGVKFYEYEENGTTFIYTADQVIDLHFMLKPNGVDHYSPIITCREAIGQAIAAANYGSKYFQNGGVPPFAITGNFKAPGAMSRAAGDLEESVKRAAKDKRLALVLPVGLDVKPMGVDPAKSQLVELQKWLVEQVARIYSIPPTFLQDLSNGTFSNTEQQDLHFVKHTMKRWVEQFEQELNLKLFGRANNSTYVELNMDGLLRGDFQTRMEGYSKAIQNAIITPNEVRRKENMPDDPAGDVLLIQGATVPLGNQPAIEQPANGQQLNGSDPNAA